MPPRSFELGLSLAPTGLVAIEAFARVNLPFHGWVVVLVLLALVGGAIAGIRVLRWWEGPQLAPAAPAEQDEEVNEENWNYGPGQQPGIPGWAEPRRRDWRSQCPHCHLHSYSCGAGRSLPPRPTASSGLRYYGLRRSAAHPEWTPGVYAGFGRLQQVVRGQSVRGDYVGGVSFEEAAGYVLRDRSGTHGLSDSVILFL